MTGLHGDRAKLGSGRIGAENGSAGGRLIKRAAKRDPAVPVGVRARLFVECCGARVWLAEVEGDACVRCPACHAAYDPMGWIVEEGQP